ncbi:quinone oxidoreductase putative [Pyrenochaeta sp. DS3sAY3a]|nr:quinone oxidoreductase putative [Pyrenochaeta sp. DS3sAY3a]
MMRAVDIRGGSGESDDLFINPETPKPTAQPGQAVVKVVAFGINRMDISQRRGGYPVPPQAPATLGVEFSGVIESLGPGEQRGLREGDEVFGLTYGGAYAEYVAVSTGMLLRKPPGLSFAQCAAIPEAWITATQALHVVLGFEKGKTILWHAGASGVSIAGIQLSKAAGASAIFATAGTAAKCALVSSEQVGATLAVNYKTQDFVEEIMRATENKGVDYIVDYVGGPYFQRNMAVAARDARIVMLGRMGGMKVAQVDISPILLKRIRIEGSTLRSRDETYQQELRRRLESFMPAFETGSLSVILHDTVSWKSIREVHDKIERSENAGKIVCIVD